MNTVKEAVGVEVPLRGSRLYHAASPVTRGHRLTPAVSLFGKPVVEGVGRGYPASYVTDRRTSEKADSMRALTWQGDGTSGWRRSPIR
jgi:hypothetical protein